MRRVPQIRPGDEKGTPLSLQTCDTAGHTVTGAGPCLSPKPDAPPAQLQGTPGTSLGCAGHRQDKERGTLKVCLSSSFQSRSNPSLPGGEEVLKLSGFWASPGDPMDTNYHVFINLKIRCWNVWKIRSWPKKTG